MGRASILGVWIALVACQQEGTDSSPPPPVSEPDGCVEQAPPVQCNCGALSATASDKCGTSCACNINQCELAGCEAREFCIGTECTECTCQPSVIAEGVGRAVSFFRGDDGGLYVQLSDDRHRIDAQGVGVPVEDAMKLSAFVRAADGTLITFGSTIVDLDSRRTVVAVNWYPPGAGHETVHWEPEAGSSTAFVGASTFSDGSIRITYSRAGVIGQATLVERDLEIVAENEVGTFDGVDSEFPQLKEYFKLPDDRVYIAGFLGAYPSEEAVYVAALSPGGMVVGQQASRVGAGLTNLQLAVAPNGNVYFGWQSAGSLDTRPSHLQAFDTNMELLWQDHEAGSYQVAGFDSHYVGIHSVPQVVRQTAVQNSSTPALRIVRTGLDGSDSVKSIEHSATQLLREGDDAVLMLVNSDLGDRYAIMRYGMSWFNQ